MRRLLVLALLCALAAPRPGQAADPVPEEDLTTWVRLHVDEEMNMKGRPLECWYWSAEGDLTAARVRSIFAPITPNVNPGFLPGFPQQTFNNTQAQNQTISTTTTTVTSLDPSSRMPSSAANLLLYGGTGALGYRYDSGTEFQFDLRYLQGSRLGESVYFYAPRLGWNFNASWEDWGLSVSLMGRGLFTGSDQTSSASFVTNTTTTTTTNTSTTGYDTATGFYDLTPTTLPPTTTTTSTTTRNTGPMHLTSDFFGGGGEVGLGVERAFEDTGLSAFARVRPAWLFGDVKSKTTFLENMPGQYSTNSTLAVSLLDVAGTIGVSYRAPFYSGLEARVGYSFENFFLLEHSREAGVGSLLTLQGVFVAVDLSY